MPYINPSVVEQAKQIDLLSYLRQREPDEIVKLTANTYATKTHNSLKISNGKWYWWSRGFGGKSALDYLVKVREVSFIDAVKHLSNSGCMPPLSVDRTSCNALEQPKVLELPPKHHDLQIAKTYLQSRGIDTSIIEECERRGLLYETRHGGYVNVVFVGLDIAGVAKNANVRGCGTDFKGESSGSDKRWPFSLQAQTRNFFVHVLESPIDALSYATLMKESGRDWRNENLLSLNGIPPENSKDGTIPVALQQYLKDYPQIARVNFLLDSDTPGFAAANKIADAVIRQYGAQCDTRIELPPRGIKDWNEYLMQKRGLQRVASDVKVKQGARKRATDRERS